MATPDTRALLMRVWWQVMVAYLLLALPSRHAAANVLVDCKIDACDPTALSLIPDAVQEPSSCELEFRGKDGEYGLQLVVDRMVYSTESPLMWFRRNFRLHCDGAKSPTGARFTLVDVSEKLVVIHVDRAHRFDGDGVLRSVFRLGRFNETGVVRAERSLGSAAGKFARFTVEFNWYGNLLKLALDSEHVFNWGRFLGTFGWAVTVANGLVDDSWYAHELNVPDKSPLLRTGSLPNDCERSVRFLDVGAGSGQMGIMVASILKSRLPDSCFHVVMSDISAAACDVMRQNVAANDLGDFISVVQGDLFQPAVDAGWSNYFDSLFFYPPQINREEAGRCDYCGPSVSLFVDNSSDVFFRRTNAEAVQVMRRRGFDILPRLWLGADEDNFATARSMEHCAFVRMHSEVEHASELLEHHCIY